MYIPLASIKENTQWWRRHTWDLGGCQLLSWKNASLVLSFQFLERSVVMCQFLYKISNLKCQKVKDTWKVTNLVTVQVSPIFSLCMIAAFKSRIMSSQKGKDQTRRSGDGIKCLGQFRLKGENSEAWINQTKDKNLASFYVHDFLGHFYILGKGRGIVVVLCLGFGVK